MVGGKPQQEKHMTKYLWGSSCILYALSVVSALLLGYWEWWVALVAVLGLATFVMWAAGVEGRLDLMTNALGRIRATGAGYTGSG